MKKIFFDVLHCDSTIAFNHLSCFYKDFEPLCEHFVSSGFVVSIDSII